MIWFSRGGSSVGKTTFTLSGLGTQRDAGDARYQSYPVIGGGWSNAGSMSCDSRNDFVYDTPMNVCEPKVTSAVAIRQIFVVQPHEVEDRGM